MTESDPFTNEDLQRVLEEEKNCSEADGWELATRTELHEIWKRSEDSTPVHLIKGFLRFPGIPPADVFELVSNLDVRRRWDKNFPVMEIIEEHEKYKFVYWRVHMPAAVEDRDLVQKMTYRRDEEKKLIYILHKNTTHPSRPEVPGLVRAETILSATLIRPEENDPNSTRVTIFLQNNAKGWIPTFLVNIFAAKAPCDWRDNLANFYHNVYKKEREQKK